MTQAQQPDALLIADECEESAKAWHIEVETRMKAAAKLRNLHAENTTLQQGYDAARLEIESLKSRLEPAGEYPPLPEPYHVAYDDIDKEDVKCFAEWQLRAYVDADRAMRAQAAPAAVAGPDVEFSRFLTDVMTAAGLVEHGKKCKALGERIAEMVMRLRLDQQPAPVAQGDAEDAARWRVINEQFIDDYLEDYELIGEAEGVGDCCYTPTETERELIKDAVLGLLSCAEDAARAQAKEGAIHE